MAEIACPASIGGWRGPHHDCELEGRKCGFRGHFGSQAEDWGSVRGGVGKEGLGPYSSRAFDGVTSGIWLWAAYGASRPGWCNSHPLPTSPFGWAHSLCSLTASVFLLVSHNGHLIGAFDTQSMFCGIVEPQGSAT